MDIAIGLPNMVPGVDGKALLEFARRADRRGFSSLGTLDRIAYPGYDWLPALAAAAAVTDRIRLVTAILISPLRPNSTLLAKQAATLDNLSGGRLTLGVAVGLREDDYEVSGVPFNGRGKAFERQLEQMKKVWAGDVRGYEPVGPPPARPGGPELIIGGSVDATFERVAEHGDGWIMGAQPPDVFAATAPKVDAAWERAGRSGKPRKLSLAYYGLGPNAEAEAKDDLEHYYGWLGKELAGMIAAGASTSEDQVRSYVQAFEDVGCDELVMFPTSADPEQADMLADAVGLGG
jgi:alkanesulfonate monooxygenase SsuD/methylene tetrahydromethanopterin reductase-like flavin-dependent oxidoreductase (luciferase family)